MQALRQEFGAWLKSADVRRFTFLDESGAQLNLTRRYGWAPRGQRVREAVPTGHGTQLTTLASLSLDGVQTAVTFRGALTGALFYQYVETVLVPNLRAGDVVLLDNLAAHKVCGVVEAIEGCGAHVRYLPPYSPDLNPIELGWSKVKSTIRQAKARTPEALHAALSAALESVSPSDSLHWFAHCGYVVK